MEVATDISRTVASQQELVLLGQAMAGMAHYIKNIVTGLEGGIFVVEEGIVRREPGEDERHSANEEKEDVHHEEPEQMTERLRLDSDELSRPRDAG